MLAHHRSFASSIALLAYGGSGAALDSPSRWVVTYWVCPWKPRTPDSKVLAFWVCHGRSSAPPLSAPLCSPNDRVAAPFWVRHGQLSSGHPSESAMANSLVDILRSPPWKEVPDAVARGRGGGRAIMVDMLQVQAAGWALGVSHGELTSSRCLMKWLRGGRLTVWRKRWLYAFCTANQTHLSRGEQRKQLNKCLLAP